jgi:hypothetical protein
VRGAAAGGGSAGRIAAPGIGGVSDARAAGRGGGAAGVGGTGGFAAGGGVGAAVVGIAACGSSRITGVSRDARAITPGVKVGVGVRFGVTGVANGVA